jgi:hypothetical protein
VDAPPPVEKRLAFDLARHGLIVAPLIVLVAGLLRGVDGALSATLALVLLLLNLLASAWSLDWASRRGAHTLMVVALCGFMVRMGVILAVMLIAEALFGWVDVIVLGVTLFVTHLGLLFWELRSVSFSLAAPGLRRDQLVVNPDNGAAN